MKREPVEQFGTSRGHAKSLGMTRYVTGKPCPVGHIAPARLTSNGGCVVCANIKRARQRKDDPAKTAAYNAAWYAANRERGIAATVDWQQRFPDRKREIWASWAATHKPELAAYQIANADSRRVSLVNRRARLRGSGGMHTLQEVKALFEKQGGLCAYCGICLTLISKQQNTASEDHIVAVNNGGSNDISNIAIACMRCNERKGTKDLDTFLSEIRLLVCEAA